MIRSHARALAWIVNEFVPWQALRMVFDRDYTKRVTRAAAVHDAAEALNEFEAEQEVHEPDPFGPVADHEEALARNKTLNGRMPQEKSSAAGTGFVPPAAEHPTIFAGAAANPSPRVEGKQRSASPAAPHTDSPTASIPPGAVGIPDPSPTVPRSSVGGDGPAAVSGHPAPPAAGHSSFTFARYFPQYRGDR